MKDITVEIPVKQLDKTLDMPAYAYPGDAGFDLRAAEDAVLAPFERKAIACGLSLAIPDGHAGLVLPRSGLAIKHGISIVNAPGLIDSGYRGELKAILINLDAHESFAIAHGDRIAQLLIVKLPTVKLLTVEELSSSERGDGGFGSSGISS